MTDGGGSGCLRAEFVAPARDRPNIDHGALAPRLRSNRGGVAWCKVMAPAAVKGINVNTNSGPGCCQGSSSVASGGSGMGKYVPTWLHGRRGLVFGAVAVVVGGAAFGWWPWLVAIGAAPILLAILPCAVMCALGFCMMGKGSKTAGAPGTTTDAAASTVVPLLLDTASEPVPSPQLVPEREHAMLR